ncbi:MAG: bifunctional [glutamate--ammonia ligase]-adenylyl-L-tyrosine phosphorylase/[glutamate--ammonia-ligase] adenylyltransferase [Ignavibacterium sp.]
MLIKLTDNLIFKLKEFTAGFLSSEEFNELIKLFESEINKCYFDSQSEVNLIRIFNSLFDKSNFLKESIQFPHYIEIIISIACYSNYLTDIIVRNPEYLYFILNSENLNENIIENEFSISVDKSISSFKTLEAKVNSLKTIKRKEILRIGIKDILGFNDLKETTFQLSALAKVLSKKLFQLCYDETFKKYISDFQIENFNKEYCIVSLGKLGGNELNYSSDIDLIIFYDNNEKINSTKEYFEILTEAIYLFIEKASRITETGYLYRIDLRLRPDGKNSPLCRTITDYLRYYETRGEDWERQMLIKADYLCGSFNLYKKFIEYLSPFIYPTILFESPLEQIKKLRENALLKLSQQNSEDNIKLSFGGIRDIEFSVQALQLINGGKIKSLRTGNTLDALDALYSHNLINKQEHISLKNSYIFFRRIEHYLQLMNDLQTHTIPTDEQKLEKLAWFFNYHNRKEFLTKLNEYRKDVINFYNSIFGAKIEIENEDYLKEINFKDINKAKRNLLYLREGKGIIDIKEFDSHTINSFIKIENNLIDYLKESFVPDTVLENFVRVIKSSKIPSLWYELFENKKIFFAFLNLCQYSQKTINTFAEDQYLHDIFLSGKVFEKLKIYAKGVSAYGRKNLYPNSIKEIIFLLSSHFALKLLDIDKLMMILSSVITYKIKSSINDYFNLNKREYKFCVCALGSFGNKQLTFASDIDLVFISNEKKNFDLVQKDFQNILLTLKKDLFPFQVDCRLRPEGKSSQIVWEIDAYKNYISSRAKIWELQAFTKIRFIFGSYNIFYQLKKEMVARVYSEDNDKIKKEISDMLKKTYKSQRDGYPESFFSSFNIKRNKGGIIDLEFILQYFLLINKNHYEPMLGKSFISLINYFNGINLIPPTELLSIKDNYIFYKDLILNLQTLFDQSQTDIPNDELKLKLLMYKMNFNSVEKLKDKIEEVKKYNHSLVMKYLLTN